MHTNLRTALRVSRFGSNDTCRKREREKEREGRREEGNLFLSFFRLSTRIFIFPAYLAWKTSKQFQESLPISQPLGPDVILLPVSSSPFSRCASNKSAESPRMPRVVTTLRYVTTLGFMAYLTGMRVTGSSVRILPVEKGRISLLPLEWTDAPYRRGIRILDGNT